MAFLRNSPYDSMDVKPAYLIKTASAVPQAPIAQTPVTARSTWGFSMEKVAADDSFTEKKESGKSSEKPAEEKKDPAQAPAQAPAQPPVPAEAVPPAAAMPAAPMDPATQIKMDSVQMAQEFLGQGVMEQALSGNPGAIELISSTAAKVAVESGKSASAAMQSQQAPVAAPAPAPMNAMVAPEQQVANQIVPASTPEGEIAASEAQNAQQQPTV